MILPQIANPQYLRGLYIVDFGEWTAVGYTADEVAMLLEHEDYRGGKVYKIHRATPDGHMELRGVSAARFASESGMFFYRNDLSLAQADFATLRDAAGAAPTPCRAVLHLSDRSPQAEPRRYVTALIFPAEHDDEIAGWLTAIAYAGGDVAEGGISCVTNYNSEARTILEHHQLWSQPAIPSRSPEQVLASVRQAVQR